MQRILVGSLKTCPSSKRYYQSLSIQINHIFNKPFVNYDNKSLKPIKDILPYKSLPNKVKSLQAQANVSTIVGSRFKKLKKFLTTNYQLNDELLISIIYVQQKQDMYIEIEQDDIKSMIDVKTIYKMGLNLYELQTSIFLLQLAEKNHDLSNVIDVTGHRIFKLFKGKEILNEYLKLKKFEEFIVVDSNISGDKFSFRYAFFMVLGMLRLSYGEEHALKFLYEKVFNGRNGTLELTISNL